MKTLLVVPDRAYTGGIVVGPAWGSSDAYPSALVLRAVPGVSATCGARVYVNDAIFIVVMVGLLFMSILPRRGGVRREKLLGLEADDDRWWSCSSAARPCRQQTRAKVLFAFVVVFAVELLMGRGVLRPISDLPRSPSQSTLSTTSQFEMPASPASERPNFFASEPSVLSKGFHLCQLWLLLAYRKRTDLRNVAVMFICTGSRY